MELIVDYLVRKRRELALLERSLGVPATESAAIGSAERVIERKFKRAAALRAERSLQSWAITETARPEVQHWRSGAYRFSFGYQRADLRVRGPPIYAAAAPAHRSVRQQPFYTGSGMSALAAVITSLVRLSGRLEVAAPRDCYGETRELLNRFGDGISIVPLRSPKRRRASAADATRVLLIDSCVSTGFDDYRRQSPEGIDVVLFDTTCFWQTSSRIRRVVEWALRSRLPIVLVRSHAKLDSLGIEYGRLGSIVLLRDSATHWSCAKELVREIEASIRLYGIAAIPAHFPPFTGNNAYRRCSRARTAAIIRNARRMARRLSASLGERTVRQFQHGLYFTLAPGRELALGDVRHAAARLCDALARQGLLVKHAGSFGFDFVAVEWFYDAIVRRNAIRIAGADLPTPLADAIADAIEAWWRRQRLSAVPRTAARIAEAPDLPEEAVNTSPS